MVFAREADVTAKEAAKLIVLKIDALVFMALSIVVGEKSGSWPVLRQGYPWLDKATNMPMQPENGSV